MIQNQTYENISKRLDRCLDEGHKKRMKRFYERMRRKGVILK